MGSPWRYFGILWNSWDVLLSWKMTGNWVILECLKAITSFFFFWKLTLLSPCMLQLRSKYGKRTKKLPRNDLKSKRKDCVGCSFVFPVFLFLTAALSDVFCLLLYLLLCIAFVNSPPNCLPLPIILRHDHCALTFEVSMYSSDILSKSW